MKMLKAIASKSADGILIVVACLVVFAIGEIGVRTYAALFMEGTSFFREDRFLSPWFTGTDYARPKYDGEGRIWFRHRETPVEEQKPEGVVRIIAVGGSTTANVRAFAVNGKDYASVLEDLLNETARGVRYEVLNAGGDGFSTAHSLINIHFRLMEFSPDAIILMHNVNDLTANFAGGGATSDYSNKYMSEFFLNPQLQTGLSFKGFLNQSRLIAATGITQMPHSILDYENSIEPGLRYFERNLRTIADICKANGTTLVLLSQPHRQFSEGDKKSREHFPVYNDKIREVSEDTGSVFVDMFARLGHDPDLFVDSIHYSPRGIEAFSKILFEDLKDRF